MLALQAVAQPTVLQLQSPENTFIFLTVFLNKEYDFESFIAFLLGGNLRLFSCGIFSFSVGKLRVLS